MAYKELGKDEVVKPGESWMGVTQGISGRWFAVQYWVNNEDTIPFQEPFDTGMGRYLTKTEAEEEALATAQDMDIPYRF